jgi:hypothetical protein
MYRKGELSPAAVDRHWPHQVILPARACEGGGYNEIHEFCKDLSLCTRGHALHDNGEWFNVYCFADPADAEKFKQRLAVRVLIRASEERDTIGRAGIRLRL